MLPVVMASGCPIKTGTDKVVSPYREAPWLIMRNEPVQDRKVADQSSRVFQ